MTITKQELIDALIEVAESIEDNNSMWIRNHISRLNKELEEEPKESLRVSREEVQRIVSATGCNILRAIDAFYEAEGDIRKAIAIAQNYRSQCQPSTP